MYCGSVDIGAKGKSFPLQVCDTEEALVRRGIALTLTRVAKASAENFKRELRCQGKWGNTLKLSYREFAGDLARSDSPRS